MNKRIKIIIKYQESKEDYLFDEIVNEFKPLIKFHLKTIPFQYKNDVNQEMLLTLYNIVHYKFKINNKFSINEEIINKIISNNFNKNNTIYINKYLNAFLNKYGDEFIRSSLNIKDKKQLFIFEYMLYCNERQFTYYLNKSFENINKRFHINYSLDNEYIVKSLNEIVKDNIEFIDLVEDVNNAKEKHFFDKYNMTDKELEFILSFIERGKILSQKEVAIKYNISQQLISKKLNKIKNKYKIGNRN